MGYVYVILFCAFLVLKWLDFNKVFTVWCQGVAFYLLDPTHAKRFSWVRIPLEPQNFFWALFVTALVTSQLRSVIILPPRAHLISSETRVATEIAAIRLGCVTPIIPPLDVSPALYRNCGSCVVLPLPVSPTMTRKSLRLIALVIWISYSSIGSFCLGYLSQLECLLFFRDLSAILFTTRNPLACETAHLAVQKLSTNW